MGQVEHVGLMKQVDTNSFEFAVKDVLVDIHLHECLLGYKYKHSLDHKFKNSL
jgi:hypothetical protein